CYVERARLVVHPKDSGTQQRTCFEIEWPRRFCEEHLRHSSLRWDIDHRQRYETGIEGINPWSPLLHGNSRTKHLVSFNNRRECPLKRVVIQPANDAERRTAIERGS